MAQEVSKIKINGVYKDIRDDKAQRELSILLGNEDVEGSIASQIKSIVSSVKRNTFKIVNRLPNISKAEYGIMYLVPDEIDNNNYVEWIKIIADNENKWERLGSTNIDINKYESKEELFRLINIILLSNGFNLTYDKEEMEDYNYITINNNCEASIGIDSSDILNKVYKKLKLSYTPEIISIKNKIGNPKNDNEESSGLYKYIDDSVNNIKSNNVLVSKVEVDPDNSILIVNDISVLSNEPQN